MNPVTRILEYKKLAQSMSETPSAELAGQISNMLDDDRKYFGSPKFIPKGFREEQAVLYITSIWQKARPSVRNDLRKLSSKAGDILLEIAEFEQIADD